MPDLDDLADVHKPVPKVFSIYIWHMDPVTIQHNQVLLTPRTDEASLQLALSCAQGMSEQEHWCNDEVVRATDVTDLYGILTGKAWRKTSHFSSSATSRHDFQQICRLGVVGLVNVLKKSCRLASQDLNAQLLVSGWGAKLQQGIRGDVVTLRACCKLQVGYTNR